MESQDDLAARLDAQLASLSDVPTPELMTLLDEVTLAFENSDAAGDLEQMRKYSEAMDAIRAELSSRDSAEEAPAADEPEAMLDEAEAVAASAEESTQTDDESTTQEGDTLVDENLTNEDVPEGSEPEAVVAAALPVIRAGGDIPGITAGAQLDDMAAVTDALTSKINSMRGISGDGEHVLVASIRNETDVPEDRILREGDAEGNSRKIRAVISDPDAMRPEALIAAGWCAPSQPVYDVPTLGTSDRPVRDSLPTFNAERGGINWITPPSLSATVGGLGVFKPDGTTYSDPAGTTATSNTNPPGGAASTKPCIEVPCGTPANVSLDALTVCLCFDNLQARAYPEWVRANTELSMVAQARFAEQYLLAKMFDAADSAQPGTGTGAIVGTPDIPLGAARDFLTEVRLVAAQFRWKNRTSPTQPLQLLAPSWLRDAVIDDLLIQVPGDHMWNTSYTEVAQYLANINVQPIWFIDDAPAPAGSKFTSYLGFAATADWLLYPTGAFVRLDGGNLDLGVVRSKEDIQKNKYCSFAETFESVAYMGPDTSTGTSGTKGAQDGWVVHGQTAVKLLGGYAVGASAGIGIPATGATGGTITP